MPTGAQNVLMRAYAARHGLLFLAPIHEDFWVRRFALRSLLEQLSEIEGVIMTSLFAMPSDQEIRHAAFKRLYESGATLHCVIENLVVHDAASIDFAEEVYMANLTISQCPRSIPKNLLPPVNGYSSFSDKGP